MMIDSFDILKHTPFMIKSVDATWLLKQAIDMNNQEFLDDVLSLKAYESTPLDHNDILESVFEVQERWMDD